MSGSKDTTHSMSRIGTRRATRTHHLAVVSCLVGALASAVAAPVAAEVPAPGPIEAQTWVGWLQDHLDLEYPVGSRVEHGPGSVAWTRHLVLEYPI